MSTIFKIPSQTDQTFDFPAFWMLPTNKFDTDQSIPTCLTDSCQEISRLVYTENMIVDPHYTDDNPVDNSK